jgi:hypothetical protein
MCFFPTRGLVSNVLESSSADRDTEKVTLRTRKGYAGSGDPEVVDELEPAQKDDNSMYNSCLQSIQRAISEFFISMWLQWTRLIAAIASKSKSRPMLLQSLSKSRNPERQRVGTCGKRLRRWLDRRTCRRRTFCDWCTEILKRWSLPDAI